MAAQGNTIIYAENVPYWMTSTTAPDSWIEKAQKEITAIGGKILGEAFGSMDGRAAYMLAFQIGDNHYKLTWPVLESKTGKTLAAKRQAATALYHDVKARVVAAKFLGARTAFASWLLLPGGKSVAEMSDSALMEHIPLMLTGGGA